MLPAHPPLVPPVRRIDAGWTVNHVVARFPATLPVFQRFGIDTCCGGAAPVRTAAARHGADPALLLAALDAVVADAVVADAVVADAVVADAAGGGSDGATAVSANR